MLIIAGERLTCTAMNNAVSKNRNLMEQVHHVFNAMFADAKQTLALLEERKAEDNTELKEVLVQVITHFGLFRVSYQKQLSKWIDSEHYRGDDKPHYYHASGEESWQFQQREYRFWYEAAIALDAWIQSRDCRLYEKKLAQAVYQNPYIDILMNSLIHKLYYQINQLIESNRDIFYDVTMELLSGQTLLRMISNNGQLQLATSFGSYRNRLNQDGTVHCNNNVLFAQKVTYDAPMSILTTPQDYPLRDKVVLLHDMADYFGKQQAWEPQTAAQGLVENEIKADCSVSIGGGQGKVSQACVPDVASSLSRKLRGVGLNHTCRDETALSSLLARKQQLFLWAGHSSSVIRMLKVACWAQASQSELTALSQALMAFWRLDYDGRCQYPFHTLHEVMDMAKNVGVNYQINTHKKGPECIHIDSIDRDYLERFIEEMGTQLESLFKLSDTQVSTKHNPTSVEHNLNEMHENATRERKRAKADELLTELKQAMAKLSEEKFNQAMDQPIQSRMNAFSSTERTVPDKAFASFYEALCSLQTLLMEMKSSLGD
ncbi:hypothetical protein [Shewanella surugensis]|uniref:Uncharacterized protein n=1 Tax=Shewanella surugensis TaxID=212020 RepID=A0ABT0LBC3_9GAMM|nr:hypothetical protein [Shewanella surugensis]MCL1124972.1 hypothetical protein [Shewanella surugensis]